MDDSAQQRLFAETPGSIEPPEKDLYLGTSGWSYGDWGRDALSRGPPSASRLAEYVKRFATVEIDSTFYGTPRRSTVQNWREVAPDGFLFAAKFPKVITHDRNLVGAEAEAENFPHTMAELGDRLGPLLLQLPPSFDVEGRCPLKTSSNVCLRASATPSRCATGAGSARIYPRCCATAALP